MFLLDSPFKAINAKKDNEEKTKTSLFRFGFEFKVRSR